MQRVRSCLWTIFFIFSLFCEIAGTSFETIPFQRRDKVFSAKDFIETSSEYEMVGDTNGMPYVNQPGKVSVKLRLKNGMDVLLISDPFVSQSAAALSVEAGSWHNPEDMPGLAHFVEHLLFMGTEKYPHESDFSRYVGERGGEYNAFTSHDRTVYGFSINHEGLEGAVDRLSHFFIDPVFSPSAIAREKNAVHHEFEDHYENDALKVWRIIKETGSSSHPNAIFSCGNLDSLALVTQQEVKAWHQRYYVPSKMHLVIISAMSLKDLVSLSVKCFGSISSSYCEEKDLTGEILSEKQKGHLVLVEPSYKNRSIQLLWEVPKEYFQDGLCSPVELLELGLDYMGEGSLFDLLTQKELANAVTVDSWQIEKDHLLFLVEISLTKDGVQQYEKVAVQVFRALNKLKEEGIPSYLHDHLYKSKQRLSEYHTPADPFDFAIDTAVTLVDEKLEEYPKAKLSSSLYNEELTKSFLSYLTAEHCAFFLVAPREEFPYKLSMLEKWMKTPYSVRPIPSKQLQAWSSAAPDAEFSIRPYDYEEIDELENPLEDSELLSALECIVDTDALRVRLAVSGDGKEDGSGAFFSIKSPLFTRSLHDAALSSLYLSCFERYMTLTISQSSKNWIIVPHESEAYLIFNFEKSFDYNAVLEFFNALCTHKGSEELFHEIKNEFLDNVPSDPDPLDHAHAALLSLLDSQTFTFIDIYKEIQKVSYDEYAFFVEHFFSHLHFDGVFFGDVSCEKADNLLREIQLCLQSTGPSLENKIPDPTVSDEPFTWNGRYVHHQKTHRKGHALLLALNLGNQSREGWVIQKILSHILQEEFFDELRTKQQTAYRVFTWPENNYGFLMQVLGLQSSTHQPEDLLRSTEEFLCGFAKNFKNKVSKERVNLIRHMLISALKRQKQAVSDEEQTSWITSAIEIIRSVTYEKICSAAEICFSAENKKRIAILVEGQ